MTTRLETLKAERDTLEAAGQWDHAALPWLCQEIERLEAGAPAEPVPAPTAPAEPAGDPFEAIGAEMRAGLADQAAGKPVDVAALVGRFNEAVEMAGRDGKDPTDLDQLRREMAAAAADPSALAPERLAELLSRYRVVTAPAPPTVAELRADLETGGLPERMRAAAELAARGLLDPAAVAPLGDEFNAEVDAAEKRGLDVEALPPELQPAARAILAAKAGLEAPVDDPVAAALHQLDQAIRSMKPPTVEETLASLGVEPTSGTTVLKEE